MIALFASVNCFDLPIRLNTFFVHMLIIEIHGFLCFRTHYFPIIVRFPNAVDMCFSIHCKPCILIKISYFLQYKNRLLYTLGSSETTIICTPRNTTEQEEMSVFYVYFLFGALITLLNKTKKH